MLNGSAVARLGLARSAALIPVPCCCGTVPPQCLYLPTSYLCPGQCGTPLGWTGSRSCSASGTNGAVWSCVDSPQQCCCPQSQTVFYDVFGSIDTYQTAQNNDGSFSWSKSILRCGPTGCVLFEQNYGCSSTGNCGGGSSTTNSPFGQGRLCGPSYSQQFSCLGPIEPTNGAPAGCNIGQPGYICSSSESYTRSCNQQSGVRQTVLVRPDGISTLTCVGSVRSVPPCLPLDRGACCCENDGRCLDGLTQAECLGTLGNSIWRQGKTCAEIDCGGPPGVCCLQPDNFCVPGLTVTQCVFAGGRYLPNGRCAPDGRCEQVIGPSIIGACCVNGICTQTSQAGCLQLGGQWAGLGVPCIPDPCGPTGACCTPIGCVNGLTQSQCVAQGGTGWFQGQSCATNPCGGGGKPTACCVPGQPCQVLPCGECTALGGTCIPQGFCNPFQCAFGACCRPDGSCTQTYRGVCEGIPGAVFIEGQPCSACPTVATNPFNPFTPQQVSRIVVPGSGCSGCGNGGGL